MILVTHFLFFVPIGPFSYVLSHIFPKLIYSFAKAQTGVSLLLGELIFFLLDECMMNKYSIF